MKKFLLKLLWFLPILLFVIGVNFYQDPANLFKNGAYELEMASHTLKGIHVTQVTNFKERNYMQLMAEKRSDTPTTLVIGSSKTLMLETDMQSDSLFYNASVSGGCMEDLLTTYNLFDQRKTKVKRLIIGVEPWYLNENYVFDRWKEVGSSYYEMLDKIAYPYPEKNLQKWYESPYWELFSLSYFQQSFVDFTRGVDLKIKPTTSKDNERATKRSDGSYSYESSYRNRTEEEVRRNAESEISEVIMKGFGDFKRLSPSKKEQFEKFITYVQKQGVEVNLVVLPYHPLVYAHFKKSPKYQIAFEADSYFRKLSQEKGLFYFGGFDPAPFGFEAKDYYDAVHCNNAAVRKFMQAFEAERKRCL